MKTFEKFELKVWR